MKERKEIKKNIFFAHISNLWAFSPHPALKHSKACIMI
jgi:hypothetical protein